MGGRGATSATGKASGVLGSKDLSRMSDAELSKIDNQFETAINTAKEKLNVLSKQAVASRENPTGTPSKEYYQVRKELTDLRTSHRNVINEISKRKVEKSKEQKSNKGTFVNSYGEATTRNITNGTYERWQRKLSKQMSKYIGG